MGLRNGEYAQYLLLNEFDLSNQRIHVIRRLGTEDEGDPGDAGDAGYVFEIRIGNATYALKMVGEDFNLLEPILNVHPVQIL